MSQTKLADWIDSQKLKHEKGTLRLRHLVNQKATPVDEWRLEKEAAAELAGQIWNSADEDAKIYTGFQRYELVLVVTDSGKTEDRARHVFRVDAGPESSDEQGETSPVNDVLVGFMKQTFSHNEVLLKTVVQVVMAGEGSRLREIERLTRRTDGLEERLDKTREEVERSKDKNHERALAKAKFEGDEKRLNEIVTTGRTMFPFLVNSIVKKNLLPTGGTSPVTEAVKVVIESLSPEQYDKLQEVLTPAQLVTLGEAVKLVKGEEKDAEQQRKKDEKH